MKNIFTLISGKELHLTEENVVIPAHEFANMVSGKELIDIIKSENKQYRQQVAQECELQKEQAQKEGFEEGMKQWAELLVQLQNDFTYARKELEKAALNVALMASKKVLGRELELHPSAIADIIATHLKKVSQYRNIVIYVSQDDLKNIETQKEKLKSLFDRLESLSIKERSDVQAGGFIIETEGGIINLSTVEKQWKPIEAMFHSLAEQPFPP